MARISLIRQIEEPRFAKIISRQLNKQRQAVLLEARKETPQIDDMFWEEYSDLMISAILPVLVGIFDRAAARTIGQTPMKQDFIGQMASGAVRWARRYARILVGTLMGNTRKYVALALADMMSTPGMTLRDFADMLEPIFGTNRAMTIAVTEFTKAHYEGTKATADEARRLGFRTIGIWLTAMDDRVCTICGPLEGAKETNEGSGQWRHPTSGEIYSPPAHPNCRCDIGYELI